MQSPKGERTIKGIDETDINLKIRDEFGKYLMSSNISFEKGVVYAGFQSVGKYKIEEARNENKLKK